WKGEPAGIYLPIKAVTNSVFIIGIAADFVVLALPITQIWRTLIPPRQKILISLMLSVGIFVTVISIVRLHTAGEFTESPIFTYDITGLTLWSVVEVDVSMIYACFPQIRMLLSRFFPKIFQTFTNRSARLPSQQNRIQPSSGEEVHHGSRKKKRNPASNVDEFFVSIEYLNTARSSRSNVELVHIEGR
ncbi:hypothetical protein EDB80DRAFT_577170, partial [Ilyonectria destructans]